MPTIVQESADTPNGTPVTLTGVVAGNALVVLLWQTSSAVRDYTISDDQSGVWVDAGIEAGGRHAFAGHSLDHPGGDVAVNVTDSGGGTGATYRVFEVSGVDEVDVVLTTLSIETNVNTFDVFGSVGVDVAANSIQFMVGARNADASPHGAVGFTEELDEARAFAYSRIDASGTTGLKGTVTSNQSRNVAAVGFSLRQAAGGGGGTTFTETHTFSAAGTAAANLVFTKIIAATPSATGTTAFSQQAVIGITSSMAATGTATLSKIMTAVRGLGVSATGTVALARKVSKFVAVNATGSVTTLVGTLSEQAHSFTATATAAFSKAFIAASTRVKAAFIGMRRMFPWSSS